MNSRIPLDDLNDAELERVSVLLGLRKSIKSAREQIEVYSRNHARRVAALQTEILTMERKISELTGGAT